MVLASFTAARISKLTNLSMQDHIGTKHLRDNDLDGTTWLRLKETRNLRGSARYKEMYALLFPDDQAGIQNPCRCFHDAAEHDFPHVS